MLSSAENPTSTSADRVRRSMPVYLNEQIDRQTENSIQNYANSSSIAI